MDGEVFTVPPAAAAAPSAAEFMLQCTFIILPPVLCSPFTTPILSQSAPWLDTNSSAGGPSALHNVAELTLATTTVQPCCHILRPQCSHKNTREEKGGHGERKQGT